VKDIYLDNSATTRVFPEVAQLVTRMMCDDYGNPSSMHLKGVEAERNVKSARETLAKILKVNEKEIYFTSGGTESDNLAIIGSAMANHRAGKHIITTKIEHPAVLQTCDYLEKQGFEVTYLSVDRYGLISLEELEKAIRPDTILVSIMHTNNEIGSLQPIEQAGALIKKCNRNTLFHVDAVQGFGKMRIYPKKWNIDLLAASSHKIHGPKGVGFLYVGEKVKIHPISYGGGHQRGLRNGTENVPGVTGMALAAQMMYDHLEDDYTRLHALKARLIEGLCKHEEVKINGHVGVESACHIISVSVRGVRSEVLLHALEDKGIYVSAGSACASNKPQISATLKAIGVEKDMLDSTVRMSLSVYTTVEEIDETVKAFGEIVPMLRRFTRR
jgi:cysteine desulfurase